MACSFLRPNFAPVTGHPLSSGRCAALALHRRPFLDLVQNRLVFQGVQSDPCALRRQSSLLTGLEQAGQALRRKPIKLIGQFSPSMKAGNTTWAVVLSRPEKGGLSGSAQAQPDSFASEIRGP
jgi:hypothetical protein